MRFLSNCCLAHLNILFFLVDYAAQLKAGMKLEEERQKVSINLECFTACQSFLHSVGLAD